MVRRCFLPLVRQSTDAALYSVDIFVNCIYLSSYIPPFVTPQTIAAAGPSRRLSVIADVSCDTTNPYNPIPVYSIMTTFDKPTVEVDVGYVIYPRLVEDLLTTGLLGVQGRESTVISHFDRPPAHAPSSRSV